MSLEVFVESRGVFGLLLSQSISPSSFSFWVFYRPPPQRSDEYRVRLVL